MVAFRGRFDGRVIIPTGEVLLPRGREFTFGVQSAVPLGDPKSLLKLAGTLDTATADEMEAAIRDECERIDNGW